MTERPHRTSARIGRLPGARFDHVFKRGRRISGNPLVLIVSARPAEPATPGVCVGVVVGRSIVRDAAPRNRLRRILRESFRMIWTGIHSENERAQLPVDMVILAREGAKAFATRMDADSVIRSLLEKWARTARTEK